MGNNHMDFDAFQASLQQQNSCSIFGVAYPALPDIPFKLGLKLQYLDTKPEEEQLAIMEEAIDFVFGAGTWAAWNDRPDFTSELLARILRYITSGYRRLVVEAMEELDRKNAETLADALTATSVSTGQPSTPISSESTASFSSNPAT